jgi:transposase
MSEIIRFGIDTSKAVFTVHGVYASGEPPLRVNLRRSQLLRFFARRPGTVVALEACGGSHYWARTLRAQGHEVRLIPPQYVKPYVKRGKNDRNDAEAICEAAGRPGMRFVMIKTEDQQARAMVLKVRQTLVDQRTDLANTARGHAAEFGLVAPKGRGNVAVLLEAVAADAAIPPLAKEMLALLGQRMAELSEQIKALEARLSGMHRADAVSRLLAGIPGVGEIIALTFATEIDPAAFASARHLAAWLGLTPKEHSTGGKPRLGGISRAGNERLRALLVSGAMSVIQAAERPSGRLMTEWLRKLLARKPRKVAAVALANKMARMIWAMMTTGEAYRAPGVVGAGRGAAAIS